jgi:hypothetical protein
MPRDLHRDDRKELQQWPDLAHLAVGVWLGFSPWLLGFFDALPTATWNALACGAILIVLATIDLEAPARWEKALLGLTGLWLALSPLALDYARDAIATAVAVATGAAVLALAAASWPLDTRGNPRRRSSR